MDRVAHIMQRYECSAETAQRYLDLRDEGHNQYSSLLMAGLSDPPDYGEGDPDEHSSD